MFNKPTYNEDLNKATGYHFKTFGHGAWWLIVTIIEKVMMNKGNREKNKGCLAKNATLLWFVAI